MPFDETDGSVIWHGMSNTAGIEKGMIQLPGDVPWAPGTIVRIEPVEEQTPTLFETLKDFDGMARDMPADLAANLDHYVHGEPQTPLCHRAPIPFGSR